MYIEQEKAEQLLELVAQHEVIIIHRHVRPDPDAIGSQLGLKALLQAKFPTKRILAAGTTTQGLKWLGEMDKVTTADYEGALAIVCDTANQPRIDGEHYALAKTLVKIDHHPPVDEYGDLQMVYTVASSCCEIIAEISRVLAEQLPLHDDAARLLYAGLVSDTGRFLYDSTTALTHEVAARLKTYSFDSYAIADHFMTMTLEEAKFQAFAYEQLQINEVGVGVITITQADIAHFGITEEQTQSIVNVPGRIEGVCCWVIFVQQQGDGELYRCRIRSKAPVINMIAAKHDGGGHPMASGANAYSQAERAQIVAELTEVAIAYRQENVESK